jgi:hypothetical protein
MAKLYIQIHTAGRRRKNTAAKAHRGFGELRPLITEKMCSLARPRRKGRVRAPRRRTRPPPLLVAPPALSEEERLALRLRVFGPRDGVPLDVRVAKDLKVVPALEGLVAEKVDLVEARALKVAEALRLVPALQSERAGEES